METRTFGQLKQGMANLLVPLSLLMLLPMMTLPAQVTWGAIFDFEFRKGGEGSALERNELVDGNPQFSVHRFQLFLDAAVDEHVAFTAKLANNVVVQDDLKKIELQLAYVSFTDIGGRDLNVSAGRILTPFGLFAKRQLSPDNPFIGSPLYFQYQLNVSPTFGYRSTLTRGDIYGGLSTMYLGGYYTGVELFGTLFRETFDFDFALTNAPISSFRSDVNTNGGMSFQGRVGVRPAMFISAGTSLSYGAFMDESLENRFLENLERYKQSSIGFDFTLDWQFYKLTGEFIYNRWNAPFIVIDYTVSPPYGSGLPSGAELDLVSREVLVDLKVDMPFLVGSYVAVRFNLLEFDTIEDPLNAGSAIAWASGVRRYALGVGYKLSRTILCKAGYEWTLVDTEPRPSINVWGSQVSVVF